MKPGIFGAGSVGCHVGGALAAAGMQPVLVGRASMGTRLANGIKVTRHDGWSREAGAKDFTYSDEPGALADCDAVLVCVKSNASHEAGEKLAATLRPGALVVSLQNGVSNPTVLREAMPGRTVLGGMVGFNIAQTDGNRFHCGTEGEVVIEAGGEEVARALNEAGVAAHTTGDIVAVQWGKLLLNLNNAVNALSDKPLKAQLSERAYRQVLAAAMREGLAVLAANGIRPAKAGRLGPRMIPPLLEMPDWLFTRVAGSMLKIDTEARSSMAEDLERGRPPEIDWLNGEVTWLGRKTGTPTPVNDRLTELVKDAFSGTGRARWSGAALRDAVLS
ncbi:2-dehydropantoate 2-reductase [Oricola cellulosilytica]|uniref:2-dehydropantoate 2-reductase n=1 Tax=Oricola cellulosilytica TaxID=1429082 RepID=A0A4R0PGF6_9HYPH|nr:2-dehydropantoate 2-reductase [Oricola cellulosilytica]TCD16158.1 2-dehydropantoate 2-reductase [Oricola cellulosilytica]